MPILGMTGDEWEKVLTPLAIFVLAMLQQWTSYRNRQTTARASQQTKALIAENTAISSLSATAAAETMRVVKEQHAPALKEIHTLVNGRMLKLLQDVAKYTRLYANSTNDPDAMRAAEEAEQRLRDSLAAQNRKP